MRMTQRSTSVSSRALASVIAAALILVSVQIAAVAIVSEGSPDPGFGSGGATATDVGGGTDRAFAVALQKDGKVVVAGLAHVGTRNEIALVRYTSGGTLDPSFSGDGKVTTLIGSGAQANAIALQPDGKIVVAGYGTPRNTPHIAVLRYRSDGSLDPTFNPSWGYTLTAFGPGADVATGVAVQADGKIVVVGNTTTGTPHMAVARFNANGTIDPTFGSGGQTEPAVESGAALGNAVAVQSNGKIVIAGGSPNGLLAVRLNSNGSPDTTFSGDGAAAVNPQTSGAANAVALESNGSITVAGHSSNGTKSNFAVARFTSNGTPDATFSGPGWTITAVGTGNDVAHGVNIQPDGKIVVSGTTNDGTHDSFAIVRYLAGGALDNNFSGDGKATIAVVNGVDNIAEGQAMGRDAKPIIVGYMQNGTTQDFGVARFIGDANAPTPGVITGLTRYTTNLAFTFGWSASDDNTGIARFDIIRNFANYNSSTFSSYRLLFSASPSSGPSVALTPGYTYCFEARAVDYAGNVGAYGAPSCIELPVDDRVLSLHGSWTSASSTRDYMGTLRQSTVAGSTLTLPVAYRHLAVVVTSCSTCGSLGVYLGSTLIATVNTFSSVTHYQRVIEVDSSATVKSGTLTLRQASNGLRVIVDAVGVSLN
jgi:uncharacterized delta-60 repeat protein